MADDDDAPIRRRMAELSDVELRCVLTVDAHAWQPRAVALARQELERRSVVGLAPYREPGLHAPSPRPPRDVAPRGRVRVPPVMVVFFIALELWWYFAR